MLEPLLAHPIRTAVAGALLATVVAMGTALAGVPEPFPVILGLAAAMPILTLSSSDRFDIERYETDRGRAGMAFDALLTASAAAILGGFPAAIALESGIGGILLVAIAALSTIIGGMAMFAFRNTKYYGER